MRRDRALDTYERVLQQHLDELARHDRGREPSSSRTRSPQRVAELRARIDENTRKVAAEQAELQAWRARKQARGSASSPRPSGYFVSENPITAAPAAAEPQGDADVR